MNFHVITDSAMPVTWTIHWLSSPISMPSPLSDCARASLIG